MGKELLFGTSNKHKFEEASKLFKMYSIVLEQHITTIPEIRDEHLEYIAKFTVKEEVRKINKALFVEDAGIFIGGLNGFPGPYSSYVQEKLGNKRILKLMRYIENRNAEFRSAIAFCEPQKEPICFVGITRGIIANEEHGDRLFGYDPIFIPEEGDGRTFSEMSVEEKNQISHRGRSLSAFIQWLIKIRKY